MRHLKIMHGILTDFQYPLMMGVENKCGMVFTYIYFVEFYLSGPYN